MKCGKCNQEISADSPFCGSCGAKVDNAPKFCPGCGSSVAADMKFCGSCGATLEDKIKTSKKVKNSRPKEENTDVSAQAVATENVVPAVAEPTAVTEATKFCGSCGQPVAVDSRFCGSCGFVFNDVAPQVQSQPVMYQQPTPTVQPSEVLKKVKGFLSKYKVPLIIVTSLIIIAVVGWTCFQKFYDFTKLSWVENYGDYDVTHITGGEIELKVEAYDKDDFVITDIEYSADGGEVKPDGTKVTWVLPEKEGTYKITAEAPSGKKITKEVEIIKPVVEEIEGGMIIPEVEATEADDSDTDGLTDIREKELGTDPQKADTDHDGIIDSAEVETTKTDPLKADTDGDTLLDGAEIELGLEPLKSDSKGDGVNDAERELNYEVKKNNVTLKVTGKGNINATSVDESKNTTFSKTEGVYPIVYDLNTNGTLISAELVIKYEEGDLEEYGITEESIALYYFDEATKKLEKVEAKVDKENNTITAQLSHFSKYVLADPSKVITTADTQVMFVIDNSVSMYSEQQMIDAGYNSSTGAIGNDTEFKRLTLTNKLIDMFTGNYKFGVAEFSGNYVNLKDFSSEKTAIKEAVNSMKSNWNSSADGTDIIEALQSGLAEFEKDDNNHYLVLLTDGKNTEGYLSSYQSSIISTAKEKNVKICVIGLGTNIDTDELDEIAEATGCDYYHASNASALDEIYALMGADINYNLVDTDNDGVVDSTIVADSGFITTRDGFSFDNYITASNDGGHCYGMATFAMLYYLGELPSTLADVDEYGLFFRGISWFHKKADGYNLKGTYFFDNYGNQSDSNLYEYKFTTEGLNIFFYLPEDYRTNIVDKVWLINDEYKSALTSSGISIIKKKYKGENFSSYESGLLDITSDNFKNNVSSEEQNLFKAIYRLFILQIDDKRYSFSTDPDESYAFLEGQLEKGVPVVLGIDGVHGVNAIRILRNNEDSNKFKIEIYDNNYPAETRYIEVTRYKMVKKLGINTWFNEYDYEFSYQGEDVSLSVNDPVIQ